MPIWDYWHRIEYRRELEKGRRVHEYTEECEDQGWATVRKGMTRDEYFAYYTKACAQEFLAKQHATPGTWIVAVYRTGTSPRGDPVLRGAIRFHWPGSS